MYVRYKKNVEIRKHGCCVYNLETNQSKIKEAIKTVVFDFDEFKKTLIEDLKKCNYTLEEWFKHIDDYDNM